MAFLLQNEDGTVEGANAYVDATEVRAYWTDRGVDLSAYTDPDILAASIRATDYLDARYSWVGSKLYRLQGTQWPRNRIDTWLRGLPVALKAAACMMTRRALTNPDLIPDPTSGPVVVESTKKVGPIEVSNKYAESSAASLATAAPAYPEVTLLLRNAGLIGSSNSGNLARG